MKCRDQCAENKPQHQEKRLNLRLSRRQISPFASSAFHPLQSRKNGKKTTTKQLNKMPWREAETNPTSKYRLYQQLYLLWNRRNAQPKAFRSLLQLIHVHLHGDKKSQVLKVLSLTGGRKPCSVRVIIQHLQMIYCLQLRLLGKINVKKVG